MLPNLLWDAGPPAGAVSASDVSAVLAQRDVESGCPGAGGALRLQKILGHTSLEMVRRYVAMANVQRSLIDQRSSAMDLMAGSEHLSRNSRRLQPKRDRRPRHTERYEGEVVSSPARSALR